MIQMTRKTTGLVAMAMMATASMAFTQPAAAAHRIHALTVHVVPAAPRPGYVGAPGYPYGPPGPIVPTLIDFSPNTPVSLFPTGLPLFNLIGL